MCWCARPGDRIERTYFFEAVDAPSGGPIQRRSDLPGCCAVVVSVLVASPGSIGFLGRDCLDRSDHVFQLGDLAQSAPSRQPIVFGHGQDKRALLRLQAFEESIELVGHNRTLASGTRLDATKKRRPHRKELISHFLIFKQNQRQSWLSIKRSLRRYHPRYCRKRSKGLPTHTFLIIWR
jgi:hypothetical protein